MTAEILQLDVYKEYSSLPKHSRGKEVLARIAEREKRALLRAELETERVMREWADSFFVSRDEVE